MSQFTFIHAADIHLDSPLKGLTLYEGAPAEKIRLAPRNALERLVDLAIERQVDFLLIAGDLYDGDTPGYETPLFLKRQMDRLDHASIPVVMIQGNHDAESVMTRTLRLSDNVELLPHDQPGSATHARLQEIGVAIHGQSFANKAVTDNLVKNYPPAVAGLFNIGLLHTSLAGAEGHEPYAPCTLEDLHNLQYDYWALGHVHTRKICCENPPVVYPGNIQGRHIRETGEKGCYLVSVDAKGNCDLQFEPLDLFRWDRCKVDATDLDTPDAIMGRFRGELEKLIDQHAPYSLGIRVEVVGATPCHADFLVDRERWTNELRAVATEKAEVWIEKIKWKTTPPDETEPGDHSEAIEAISDYVDPLTPEERTKLVEKALALFINRLPEEIKTGHEPLTLDAPEQRDAWLRDACTLLTDSLNRGEVQ